MLAYAKWIFYANGYDKGSKITRLAAWNQVKRTSGLIPQGLKDEPELREDAAYLWDWYLEIKQGCEKVGYVELKAYQEVTSEVLTPFEASIMVKLDLLRQYG